MGLVELKHDVEGIDLGGPNLLCLRIMTICANVRTRERDKLNVILNLDLGQRLNSYVDRIGIIRKIVISGSPHFSLLKSEMYDNKITPTIS